MLIASKNKSQRNIEGQIICEARSNIVEYIALIISIGAAIISGMVFLHQQEIEEATLQVGYPQHTQDKGIYPAIRIPLINGYYARYPTQIISISVKLNENKIDFLNWIPPLETDNTTYPKNYALVERDKPTYLKFVFFNETEYPISEYDRSYTMKYVIPQVYLKLLKEENNMVVGIQYIDFSKMKEFTVISHFTFGYSNKNITSIHLVEAGRDDGTPLPKKIVVLPD